MNRPSLRALLIVALIAAAPISAQKPSAPPERQVFVIDDPLFRPLTFPAVLPFGYPPNTIHKPTVLGYFKNRQFDSLEILLGGLRRDVVRDPRYEDRLFAALRVLDSDDPELLASIDAWIKTKPRSAHAHVARAHYHLYAAWRARGVRYIRDTPPERVVRMEMFAKLALLDIDAGLAIDSTYLPAFDAAIRVLQIYGSNEDAAAAARRGLSFHPGSYELHNDFMQVLKPRWGGSYELMAEFAELAARSTFINPRLATLRGAISEDLAFDLSRSNKYEEELAELTKALAYGPDWRYLLARGVVYYYLKQYDKALNDLHDSLIQYPESAETLKYYGGALLELSVTVAPSIRGTVLDRATEALRLAAYLSPGDIAIADWLKYAINTKSSCRVAVVPCK